jgi:hypothetical protein
MVRRAPRCEILIQKGPDESSMPDHLCRAPGNPCYGGHVQVWLPAPCCSSPDRPPQGKTRQVSNSPPSDTRPDPVIRPVRRARRGIWADAPATVEHPRPQPRLWSAPARCFQHRDRGEQRPIPARHPFGPARYRFEATPVSPTRPPTSSCIAPPTTCAGWRLIPRRLGFLYCSVGNRHDRALPCLHSGLRILIAHNGSCSRRCIVRHNHLAQVRAPFAYLETPTSARA